MNQNELRETIVWAAMPLIGEYDTLTTEQIAHAAGIDEAALLAVFDDKDAVVQACMVEMQAQLVKALDPAEAVRELDAVSTDQPLDIRLVAAVKIMDSYYERSRARLEGIEQSTRPRTAVAGEPPATLSSREDLRVIGNLPETRQAVERLLAPDQDRLRLQPDVLAEAFLGMSLGAVRAPHPGRSPLLPEELVDLFLHGARTDG